jgi:dephospho-CoA kinase
VKKVGITGGIASGKSLLAKIIEEIGFPVFYSDRVSRKLVNESEGLRQSVIELLGSESYSDGKMNNAYVAKIIFNNPQILEKLNRIIHPEVRKTFLDWCTKQTADIVFNEAAILFETGAYANFDATILVTAPLEIRINRAIIRDKSNREDILKRIEQQWTDEKKIPLASFVLVNDDQTPFIQQVEALIYSLS